MSAIEIACGRYAALIHPACGGMVGALSWRAPDGRTHQILRPESDRAPSTAQPNHFGTWAMLPFANRAFGSVVDDGARRFAVPPNDPAGTIHGFGWQSGWEVLKQEAGRTVLEHVRNDGPDPYRYRAAQEIRLDHDGMTIGMTVTNLAQTALPYGMGHHPWFACAADTRLRMRAQAALVFGEGFRASGHRALDGGGPYARGPVFATGRETAWSFLGWDGVAEIETPSSGLAIRLSASETLRCPVVWAPAGADFLCVEPQSHAIGSPSEAAARDVSPLTRLGPGETLAGWMRIEAGVARVEA